MGLCYCLLYMPFDINCTGNTGAVSPTQQRVQDGNQRLRALESLIWISVIFLQAFAMQVSHRQEPVELDVA